MTNKKHYCFQWNIEDVDSQLLGIVDAIGKDICITNKEKKEILQLAIQNCEDEIIEIINIEIQNIIIERKININNQRQ